VSSHRLAFGSVGGRSGQSVVFVLCTASRSQSPEDQSRSRPVARIPFGLVDWVHFVKNEGGVAVAPFTRTHMLPVRYFLAARWAVLFAAAMCGRGVAPLYSQVSQTSPTDPAREEAAYATSITRVADSAIHRLDFFPARSQLRVQMLFMTPRDSAGVLFVEIGRRSLGAAMVVDEIGSRFESVRAPDDLRQLHAQMVASLHAARSALDRLAASANACQYDVTSVQRCQAPFTAASSALGQAYKRYLETRVKIRDQIVDTQTVLPDFKPPAPAPAKRTVRTVRTARTSRRV